MRLDVDGVSVDLAGRPVVQDVRFEVAPGTVTGVVGPNGSGKSTLCRTLYRAHRPRRGTVRVGGSDVHADLTAREAARRVAAVVQHPGGSSGETSGNELVEDVVLVGRTPHLGPWGRVRRTDRAAVHAALERVGCPHLTGREFGTLSGGERQRVLLARALAQEPRVLVLDEPTNHLDIAGQLDLLHLVRTLPVTVVTVLHDLNLAAAACDQVVVLDGGRVVGAGTPRQVLVPDLLHAVFGVRAHCGTNPLTGSLQLSYALDQDRTPGGNPRSETPCAPHFPLSSPSSSP